MSNWTVKCASTRCNHTHTEDDRIPKGKPGDFVRKLGCPKCGCESFYKAKPKDIERAATAKAARMDAAVTAQ